jgi:hypothetical protein
LWGGHIARRQEKRNAYRSLVRKTEEKRAHLEDQDVGTWIILKWILDRMGWFGLDLSGSSYGLLEGFCEQGIEPSGYTILPRKLSAPREGIIPLELVSSQGPLFSKYKTHILSALYRNAHYCTLSYSVPSSSKPRKEN